MTELSHTEDILGTSLSAGIAFNRFNMARANACK